MLVAEAVEAQSSPQLSPSSMPLERKQSHRHVRSCTDTAAAVLGRSEEQVAARWADKLQFTVPSELSAEQLTMRPPSDHRRHSAHPLHRRRTSRDPATKRSHSAIPAFSRTMDHSGDTLGGIPDVLPRHAHGRPSTPGTVSQSPPHSSPEPSAAAHGGSHPSDLDREAERSNDPTNMLESITHRMDRMHVVAPSHQTSSAFSPVVQQQSPITSPTPFPYYMAPPPQTSPITLPPPQTRSDPFPSAPPPPPSMALPYSQTQRPPQNMVPAAHCLELHSPPSTTFPSHIPSRVPSHVYTHPTPLEQQQYQQHLYHSFYQQQQQQPHQPYPLEATRVDSYLQKGDTLPQAMMHPFPVMTPTSPYAAAIMIPSPAAYHPYVLYNHQETSPTSGSSTIPFPSQASTGTAESDPCGSDAAMVVPLDEDDTTEQRILTESLPRRFSHSL